VTRAITGATIVAGVAGSPVAHSLSPLIHNAWIAAAGLDAVYVPFAPPQAGFADFARGLIGGAIRGLNVTTPFKQDALSVATRASERAVRAGAANLLVFSVGGGVFADNTDGEGLLAALAARAPSFDPAAGAVTIIGAGGAARGAAAALKEAGAPDIRIVNRTASRAAALAALVGAPARATPAGVAAFVAVQLVVNATTLGLGGGAGPAAEFAAVRPGALALDMVYRPLRTDFLARAEQSGLVTVDGLEMLIRQAAPSFEALFGAPPPSVDVRALCLRALRESAGEGA
jgi:shikimate dehydrogenase